LRQPPGRHLAGKHVLGAVPQHPDDARRDEEDRGAGQNRACLGRAPRGRESLLGRRGEAIGGRALHAEGEHRPNRADRLRRVGGGIGEPVLRETRAPANAASGQDERQHDHRNREEHEDGELEARHHHHGERAEEQERVAQRDRDADAEGRLHLRRVGGEARDDFAALGCVEVGRVERGEAPEHGGAQVRDDALAERDDEVVAGSAREREHGDDDDQHAEIGVQDVAARLGEAAVDDPAHRERQGERRGRGHCQGDERQGDAAPVGEGERDERLEGAERGLGTTRGGCGGHDA
jgi:hypothetical protein